MVTAFDVPADKLIKKASEKLQEIPDVKPPKWMAFVKSGAHVERAPQQPDFWYLRCASLLRRLYIRGNQGVGGLRDAYGGRKHRGSKPEKHAPAGGNIIRKGMQQLEKAGLVKKEKTGRVLTPKGVAFMDAASKESRG